MKILIISNGDFFSTYGGGQVYVKNLVDEMINQQMDIVVFSFLNKHSGQVFLKKEYRGIELYEWHEKNLLEISSMICKISPDIVHAHAEKMNISKLCKELSIPCVITIHHGGLLCPAGALMNYKDEIIWDKLTPEDSLPNVLRNIKGGLFCYPLLKMIPFKVRLKIGLILEKLPFIYFVTPIGKTTLAIEKKREEWETIIKNVDLMIAPSDAIAKSAIVNGLDESKVRVMPHGIPINHSLEPFAVNSRPDRKLKFFYCGRICHIKGIHVLLNAFSQLDEPESELHLIGSLDGKYERKLKKKYEGDHRIVFHGKINPEDVPGTIRNYDVMVHPAICMEVFGLNIAEALSEGKPVIATRCGGAEMQICDGKNGLLVPPNDVGALVQAMQKVIDNPPLVKAMALEAPKHVVSMEDHVKQLTALYIELVTRVITSKIE